MCFDDKIYLGMMPNPFKNTPKKFRLRRAALRPGGPTMDANHGFAYKLLILSAKSAAADLRSTAAQTKFNNGNGGKLLAKMANYYKRCRRLLQWPHNTNMLATWRSRPER